MPRVVFTFDDRTLEYLKEMTRCSKEQSMAAMLRRIIRDSFILYRKGKAGFTECRVHNPLNDATETVHIEVLNAPVSSSAPNADAMIG